MTTNKSTTGTAYEQPTHVLPMDGLYVTITCHCAGCGAYRGFQGSLADAEGKESIGAIPYLALTSFIGVIDRTSDLGWTIIGEDWYCKGCAEGMTRTAPKNRGVQ